jgi:RNA-directed DNA polymerase
VEEKLLSGNTWVVDADIKSYFDRIPHQPLIKAVSRKIADGKVIKRIESYLKAGVMESLKEWQPTGGVRFEPASLPRYISQISLSPFWNTRLRTGNTA